MALSYWIMYTVHEDILLSSALAQSNVIYRTIIATAKWQMILNHATITDQPEWAGTPWTLYPSRLRRCSYSSQNRFQTQGWSRGREKNKLSSKYVRGRESKQMSKPVCLTLWRWPFTLQPFLICCCELSCSWISYALLFSQWSWKKTPSLQVCPHEMLMTCGRWAVG